jgi:two-component system, OmpR family, sensor kinase
MDIPEPQPLATAATPESGRAEDLHRQVAELGEAVAARDTFIAVAAHELRNPMTPIIGQIELLLSAVRSGRCSLEQVGQRLERIQHAMDHYLKRTATLLDVSRITTGKFRLELAAFDLTMLLREVVDGFGDMARRLSVPITISAPDSLPVTLDRLAVEQILDNLVSNALKYGARKPIEITAEIVGEQVRVQVRDHGAGISEQDRGRIFQRFERAVGQGEQRSGFGIGLWVVGQFVESMNGQIMVDPAPGGGSRFTIMLPLHLKG